VSILIDTHVFLWAAGAPSRLSESAETLLRDRDEPIFFSAASAWEIAIKWSKAHLDLPESPDEIIKKVVSRAGLSQLSISLSDACAAAELPLHHKDPFDRLLIAQARLHGLKLMTANPVMERYDVDLIALWLDDDE
jgi:PIN domain nuclease of toxin-antitoxin system